MPNIKYIHEFVPPKTKRYGEENRALHLLALTAETSKNGSLIIKIYIFVHDPHCLGVALLFFVFYETHRCDEKDLHL